MEQKLGNLPASGDEFWNEAIKFSNEGRPRKECSHNFIYRSATEAECSNCHIGFFLLGEGEEIKEGHVYKHDKLVI